MIAAGEDFLKALHKIEFETRSLTDHRSKILLGAVYQPVKPGASLAVGLQKTKCWLPSDLSDVPELSNLLEFIEKLASP